MSKACGQRAFRLAVMIACLVTARASGQDSLPPLHRIVPVARREIHVKWGLVDFIIMADSVRGVSVYMAPNQWSLQGADHANVSYIAFDPSVVRQWTLVMEQRVGEPWPESRPTTTVPLGVTLPSTSGRAFFMFGKDPSTRAYAQFLMVYRDSVSHTEWTAYSREDQLRDLLHALDEIASLSRYDPELAVRADSASGLPDSHELQQMPKLVSMQRLALPSRLEQEGRVWVRYVVDQDGRVDPGSIHIMLSDGPLLTDAVRKALATAVYQPGRAAGVAVRVLCFQVFSFTHGDKPWWRNP